MLILGSTSPRRKEILSFFKIPFNVIPPDFDELSIVYHGNHKEYVESISKGKAKALLEEHPGIPILTADTIVTYDNEVFLKPSNKQEAFQMLKHLCGQTHQVLTAVTVGIEDRIETVTTSTDVTFQAFSDDEIQNYISAIHVMDKAGSYAIQGIGSIIVKKIEGCFYNVMGLPLKATQDLLTKFGFPVWDHLKSSPSS